MARGKTIPPLIKAIIVREYEHGKSQAQLGRELKLNRQTINRVIQRHRAAQEAQRDDQNS